MSTAFVTSLAVPRAGILDLFASLLLARAVDECSEAGPGENNLKLVQAFLQATSLTDLVDRPYRAQQRANFMPSASVREQRTQLELEQHASKVRQGVEAMARGFVLRARARLKAVVQDQSLAPRRRPVPDPAGDLRRLARPGPQARAPPSSPTCAGPPAPPEPLKGTVSREKLAEWRDATAKEAWTSAWQSNSAV